MKNKAQKEKLDEGKKLKENVKNQEKIFLKKKQEKIDILDKENIDNKYKTDLYRMSFMTN